MNFSNSEWLFSLLYPSLTWSRKTGEKVIYLTFDDGPVPDHTPYVLEQLRKYKAQATFFCVGHNIEKHPDIYDTVMREGHKIGNHTYNHLNGWKTEDQEYLDNVEKCRRMMDSKVEGNETSAVKTLFRPPYGKIKRSQIKALKGDYEIIMWGVLTGDYRQDLSPEKCLEDSIRYSVPGSIVVFHDSIKSERNLRYVLPRYIEHFLEKGYTFKCL